MLGKFNLVKTSWSVTGLAGKVAVVGVATIIGIANVVGSAGASLNAIASNTTPQAINSGTLSLILSPGAFGASTSAGFDTYANKMRPLDSFSRFVTYTTGADMGIASPTLAVTATGDAIMRDATYGLRVWVQRCTTAWATDGTCGGLRSDLFGVSGTPVAISTLATATAITSFNLAASGVNYLKYTISLPTKTETNTNGTISGFGAEGTIQGKAAALTWTLTADQSATTVDTNA
ncbi:MAG: hypothetical protein F2830_04440 [Actinobacteria bacterium]|uniref:Unannotated protein n=1 Tax=freshwater metagenome TaxID=449393 RepID=A0A6J6QV35_9ZZZZ|nr:hypothetical protein [Actinomycetota bacterium]MSZ64374.1 hypothetical protein [Actinomycetota bacterium]MTA58508.1 hypothetical protein [Actinomycetota bacterium]